MPQYEACYFRFIISVKVENEVQLTLFIWYSLVSTKVAIVINVFFLQINLLFFFFKVLRQVPCYLL